MRRILSTIPLLLALASCTDVPAAQWVAPKTCPDLSDHAFSQHDSADQPAIVSMSLDCRYTGTDGSELSVGVFDQTAASLRKTVDKDAQGQSDFTVKSAPSLGPNAFVYAAYTSTCAVVVETAKGALEVNLSDPSHARQCQKTVIAVLKESAPNG